MNLTYPMVVVMLTLISMVSVIIWQYVGGVGLVAPFSHFILLHYIFTNCFVKACEEISKICELR